MPCTTLLVGKKVSNDGTPLISRTDDGGFTIKKIVVVNPKDQPKTYKSVLNKFELQLPNNPLRYTACPNVDLSDGIWAASGINEKNVAMTATETITTNPRVLGADPFVRYQKKTDEHDEIPGGIGEEDFVVCVLPYISSAREGAKRLGSLIETLGTNESNGIAFSDENEIWWLETIGGHNWLAVRVPDDVYVMAPNQFSLDHFDLEDAYSNEINNMCSKSLKDLIVKNNLGLDINDNFNPRLAFGSHSDNDHIYNTPRAWYMLKYFNPTTYKYYGPQADFTPESDNIPWSCKPERKITIEDVKYILSSYYQDTPYNPYKKMDDYSSGKYRPIGVSYTDCTTICQIRNNVPEEIKAIEWYSVASNAFNTIIPLYSNVDTLPEYISKGSMNCSTDDFYWSTRLINVLGDIHKNQTERLFERYIMKTMSYGREIINKYDELFINTNNINLLKEANELIVANLKKETINLLNELVKLGTKNMKNVYHMTDN